MLRRVIVISIALVAALTLLAGPAFAARSFPQTGYSVTNARFLDYFDHRGGVKTFGYPISRELDLLGTRVQFFQRAVLQQRPDGSVGLLNILDEGLLPYTRINGSTFPAPDPFVIQAAPSAADPSYAARAIDFVRANAPDNWNGLQTNFFATFMGTVSYNDAFPTGGVDPGLLPLINLEIWGLPTSRPAFDPNNHSFVYLRFQRGIMHFDRSSGLTQGILIGDYLKAVLTGQNLPADLAQQASGSRLHRQYDNSQFTGVARPSELPGSQLFASFERDGVYVPVPPPVTPTPVPPIPTPVPAATAVPQAPASIEVVGSPRFVEQIHAVLHLLATKSPFNYDIVRQNVWRIVEEPVTTTAASSTDPAARTLKIVEWTAFASGWDSYADNQREWLAGLIVHNAVRIAQHHRGVAISGADATLEALLAQQDTLAGIETTWPAGQFWKWVQNAIDNNTGWWSPWQQPREPETE